MPMPLDQIRAAIDDRLQVRWRKRLIDENAAPVAVIALKQLAGPDFSTPVICTCEDMPDDLLAELLIGIGRKLQAG